MKNKEEEEEEEEEEYVDTELWTQSDIVGCDFNGEKFVREDGSIVGEDDDDDDEPLLWVF